jgi:nicotinamidase-related amidase
MYKVFGKRIHESVAEIIGDGGVGLVLVDVLNDFYHRDGFFPKGGWSTDELDATLPPMKELLRACRDADALVVHAGNSILPAGRSDSAAFLRFKTRHIPRGTVPVYTIEGTWGADFLDGFGPLDGELVVRKHRPSAFVATDLDQLLRSNGVKSVIIAGCVTEGCVQETATDAMFRDYFTIVPTDCTASYDPTRHANALTYLAPRVELVESGDVIAALAAGRAAPRRRDGAGLTPESPGHKASIAEAVDGSGTPSA